MFDLKSSKKIFHANQIKIFNERIANSYPYVVRSTRNNGIRGYIIENENFLNPANTLSFAQDTFSVFYQKEPYFTGNKVKVLISKFKEFNPKVAIFMSGICQKVLESFTWGVGSTEDSIKEILISLPVYNIARHCEEAERPKQSIDCHEANASRNDEDYKIAFDYMESYIQELEAYLLVAGLKDTKLSEKEKEALRIFAKLHGDTNGGGALGNSTSPLEKPCHIERSEISQHTRNKDTSALPKDNKNFETFANSALSQIATKELEKAYQYDNIKWQEFKLGELFEVKSNPQLNKDSFEFDENAEFPYFTRTCLNNGIAGYVKYLDEEHKIKGNSIAVGMLGMQFFYMQKDFYAGQFTKTIYPKFEKFNKLIAHFFIAWLNKSQKSFQGVLVRDFEKTFNESVISLPVYRSRHCEESEATRSNPQTTPQNLDCHENSCEFSRNDGLRGF